MTMKKTGGAICAVSIIVGIVLSMDSGLRINREGLELIGNAEACRREPYVCPAGVLTDGVGNTNGVIANKIKTDEEIARDWVRNIAEAEKCINNNFNGTEMPTMPFSMMTSAAFNVGCGGLMTYVNKDKKRVPTTIWKKAQVRDWKGMCERLPDFNKSGGVALRGLTIRRNKEMSNCLESLK